MLLLTFMEFPRVRLLLALTDTPRLNGAGYRSDAVRLGDARHPSRITSGWGTQP